MDIMEDEGSMGTDFGKWHGMNTTQLSPLSLR